MDNLLGMVEKHLTHEDLDRLASRDLSASATEVAREHLSQCDVCADRYLETAERQRLAPRRVDASLSGWTLAASLGAAFLAGWAASLLLTDSTVGPRSVVLEQATLALRDGRGVAAETTLDVGSWPTVLLLSLPVAEGATVEWRPDEEASWHPAVADEFGAIALLLEQSIEVVEVRLGDDFLGRVVLRSERSD